MKKYLILGVMLILALFLTASVGAAPLANPVGALPLYDSGFVLTTPSTSDQTFIHDIGHIPSLWSITCGSGPMGNSPTASPTYFPWGDSGNYGHLVVGLHPDVFEVRWYASGIAYNKRAGWHQAGEAYCRLRVYAAD